MYGGIVKQFRHNMQRAVGRLCVQTTHTGVELPYLNLAPPPKRKSELHEGLLRNFRPRLGWGP